MAYSGNPSVCSIYCKNFAPVLAFLATCLQLRYHYGHKAYVCELQIQERNVLNLPFPPEINNRFVTCFNLKI